MSQRLPTSLPRALGGIENGNTGRSIPAGSSSSAFEANNPVSRNKALLEGQRYVPGLHTREEADQLLPQTVTRKMARVLPKDLPPGLLEDFLSREKHPVSALMEYCASTRLHAEFREVAVDMNKRSILNKFACMCIVNGRIFEQGTGKTKKDAKTHAASIAFKILVGLEDDDKEETGTIMHDAHGKKIAVQKNNGWEYSAPRPNEFKPAVNVHFPVNLEPKVALPSVEEIGATPHWDAPKHPVQIVMEYCQKNSLECEVKVSDEKTSMGFKACVYIEDEIKGEAQAPNKKEAKKKAALEAIKNFLPDDYHDTVDVEAPSMSLKSATFDDTASMSSVTSGYSFSSSTSIVDPVLFPPVSLPKRETTYYDKLVAYCKRKKYILTVDVPDTPTRDGYEVRVLVDGKEWGFSAADTIKEAKSQAAELALDNLYQCDPTEEIPTILEDKKESGSYHDIISDLAWEKYGELVKQIEGEDPRQHTPMAAFILRKNDKDGGEVVALGSGAATLPTNSVAPTDGRTITDCHAVVIARRSLLKFIYRELSSYYKREVVDHDSIFEEIAGSRKLKVKESVTFHLYLSCAPCGDGSVFSPKNMDRLTEADWELMSQGEHHPDFDNEDYGKLRIKTTYGYKTKDISELDDVANTNATMSCSDKLLKWNNIGLQGGLLSHFMEPFYFESLTLGFQYHHGHITRAVSGRITDDLCDLQPPFYQSNYPYVGRVTTYDIDIQPDDPNIYSINWSHGDEKLEILDGVKGKSTVNSPFRTSAVGASRLSKAGFLFRFRDLARTIKDQQLLSFQTYRNAKQSADVYQTAKRNFYQHVESHNFGRWIKRPAETEMFQK